MLNQIPFFYGVILLLTLFIICLSLVIGIKVIYNFFTVKQVKTDKPTACRKKPYDKKVKPNNSVIRSIEINPEEIDRIYVKRG